MAEITFHTLRVDRRSLFWWALGLALTVVGWVVVSQGFGICVSYRVTTFDCVTLYTLHR